MRNALDRPFIEIATELYLIKPSKISNVASIPIYDKEAVDSLF